MVVIKVKKMYKRVEMKPEQKKVVKTAAYYIGFVALGMSFASLGPTLPGLARNTKSMFNEISWLFFTHSAGYSISSLFGGRLYDRFRGHPLMAGSLGVIVVAMATIPLFSRLSLLAAVFFVRGLASGSVDVGGNTLLIWVHGDRSGPWLNLLHFFFGTGGLLAPVVVAQSLLVNGDIATAYRAIAAFVLPVAIWTACIESPGIVAAPDDSRPRSARAAITAVITFFFFLHVGIQTSFSGWISTYAIEKGILNEAGAAYLASLFWASLAAGRLAGVPISLHAGPFRILAGNLCGCLLGAGLLFLFPDSRTVLWLGTFLMGFSLASMFPVSILFARRFMHITGSVMGIFLVGANFGSMVIPWAIGQLFERRGPRVLSGFLLVLVAAAFVVLLVMQMKASGTQKEQARGNG
jgi:FHS family Na+ dependent glucose MFS transporter 1